MDSSAAIVPSLVAIVATLFLIGAGLIVVAGKKAGPSVASRLWAAYFTEFGILAVILVPAYFGVWPLLVSLLCIGVTGSCELYGTLRRIGLASRAWIGSLAGAYLLVGSLVGGPKIWRRLSPNKTVAGSLAGLGATIAGAGLLAFAVPALTATQVIAAGLLIALAGQAGDLVASSIKRMAGVKDFSGLVPVQGGVLDIYDALIFSSPVFYWYVRFATASWT